MIEVVADFPEAERELAFPNGHRAVVKQGETIKVPDEFAKGLLAQDIWKPAKKTAHAAKENK